MSQKREIKCPQCGRLTFYSIENPARPFCSDRCKLIDLGEWAEGKYTIPVEDSPTLNSDLQYDEEE